MTHLDFIKALCDSMRPKTDKEIERERADSIAALVRSTTHEELASAVIEFLPALREFFQKPTTPQLAYNLGVRSEPLQHLISRALENMIAAEQRARSDSRAEDLQ